MSSSKILGFDKNVFWMGITSFFTDVGSEMIYPILPIFLSSVLGVNKAFIGLIEGIAEATASLLKLVSGWVSDKMGKRKEIVVLGYSLSTIAKPFLALATSGWHVLGLRFLDKLGKGLRTSPRDALIAESCDSCDRGKSFGFHRALDSAGAMVGPGIAFVLMPLLGGLTAVSPFRIIFLLSTIPATIAVIILILFVRDIKPQISCSISDPEKQSNLNLKSILNKKFIVFMLIFTLFTLGNSSDAFLILRAQDLNISLFFIPLLWMMFNAVYTAFSFPAGKISDIIGRKKVLVTGLIVYSLVYFGFGTSSQAWHIWVLFALYGAYYGITEGTSRALIADSIPAEVRATAYGAYNTVIGISAFFSSVIMGLLWQTFGATVAFTFGGSLAAVSSVLMLLFI